MMNFLREYTHKQSHTERYSTLYLKHFQSYSNWQLHSTIDIHWPLSNTSTRPNYTSLDNNHDNSASSVSHKETLQAMHAQTISLKQQIKGQTFEPATIGCFYWLFFNSLTCLSSNNSTSQQWEVIFRYQNALYTYFSLKRTSQIQLTCQHIDDMQLEIRFIGVLLVSCRTNHSPSQNQPTVALGWGKLDGAPDEKVQQ